MRSPRENRGRYYTRQDSQGGLGSSSRAPSSRSPDLCAASGERRGMHRSPAISSREAPDSSSRLMLHQSRLDAATWDQLALREIGRWNGAKLVSRIDSWRIKSELNRFSDLAMDDAQPDSHSPSIDKKKPPQQDLASSSSSRSFSSGQSCLPGIIYPPLKTVGKSTNIFWQDCMVAKADREKMLKQKGCVVWITGLSGSGKSTLACTLDHALLNRGRLSYVLDGDNLRHGLNNNLGFSAEDRAENIRRVGEVAKLFADAGLICIASFISPYRKDRDACRRLLPPGDFIEVYLKVPLTVCEKRDPKGLYKLARAGKIKGFTGIDDPYEEPEECEVVMETAETGGLPSPSEMASELIAYLEERGYLG